MRINEGIRVEAAESCLLCRGGGEVLYEGLRDRLFGAPGTWSLLRCKPCGLVWLDPQPIPEDIPKLYETYTHQNAFEPSRRLRFRQKVARAIVATTLGYDQLLPGPRWRWVGRLAGLVPPWRDYAMAPFMYLEASARGKLVDVGCGIGGFMAVMRDLGWEVEGVEPDPEAARIAREERGLKVRVGTLEGANLSPESQDVITMSHVIEHLPDPSGSLKQCYTLLRPGGLLVVVTPNVKSMGHQHFRSWWYGLDPPRHLVLFSPVTLGRFTESAGFHVRLMRTATRWCRGVYIESVGIQRHSRFVMPNVPTLLNVGSWAFWLIEETLRLASFHVGEELLMLAMKPRKDAGEGS
jgi:2-polyprenyl-3-methyl-5-hydroxy-6-metoxy-1,4-benzoquinol methylase